MVCYVDGLILFVESKTKVFQQINKFNKETILKYFGTPRSFHVVAKFCRMTQSSWKLETLVQSLLKDHKTVEQVLMNSPRTSSPELQQPGEQMVDEGHVTRYYKSFGSFFNTLIQTGSETFGSCKFTGCTFGNTAPSLNERLQKAHYNTWQKLCPR